MPRSTPRSRKIDAARMPSAARRAAARRLFAQALETPGGLKVQTIHAFCTRLLHQFPFEADVAARFEVLDERSDRSCSNSCAGRAARSRRASRTARSAVRSRTAIIAAADQTFSDVVGEAIRQRDEIDPGSMRAGGIDAAIARAFARARHRSGRHDRADRGRVLRRLADRRRRNGPRVIAALDAGLEKRQGACRALRRARDADRHASASRPISSLLHGRARAAQERSSPTAIRTDHPTLFERLLAEQDRVCALIAARSARRRARAHAPRWSPSPHAVIARYPREKDRRGLLDYDDLIDKTLALLSNVAPPGCTTSSTSASTMC